MVCHLPVVDVGRRLHNLHKPHNLLHRGIEHTRCMLHGFLLHVVSRLKVENAQRQREDRDSHQQDAEAELPGKRLADMSDDIAHL